jgi:hypothetical protein
LKAVKFLSVDGAFVSAVVILFEETFQPCIEVGYVVIVSTANPVKLKFEVPRLCGVGFVCA